MSIALRALGRRIALAVLPLLAAACSHDVLEPAPPPAAAAPHFATATSGRPKLVGNAVKYRELGAKPASGRSGTSVLAARALVGMDGATDLEVTTGAFDPAPVSTRPLTRVQVKQFDPAGRPLRTFNYNGLTGGSAAFRYPALPRGATLQVQGNVTDGKRTDVVTVTAPVYRRPDLQVRLEAPEEATPGFPVNLVATVGEGNGDLGARTDCVLYVDGAEADRARGIWVDAGDAVSCAFTYAFTSPGYHRVLVEAAGASPADFDPGNNVAGATVLATPNAFHYTAVAEDYVETTVQGENSRTTYDRGATIEQQWTTRGRRSVQSGGLYALIRHGMSLDAMHVRVSQSTNGGVVHAGGWPDATEGYPLLASLPQCASEWSEGAMLYLCTVGGADVGVTLVQYLRSTSNVTYFGLRYLRTWFPGAPENVYAEDSYGNDTQGASQIVMGADYSFAVELADGGQTYRLNATVPLGAPQTSTWTWFPPTGTRCSTQYFSDAKFTSEICRYHRAETVTRRGHVSGMMQ